MPLQARSGASLAGIGLAAALSLLASAGADETLRTFWLRGDFPAAEAYIQAHNSAGDQAPAFLSETALAWEQMGKPAAAAASYGEWFLAAGPDASAQLEAKLGEWRCRRAGAEAGWADAAKLDVAQRLAASAGQKGPARRLALELQTALAFAQEGVWKSGEELRQNYPDSPVVQRDLKARCDRLSREPDPAKRAAGAKQLLADYPGCYWRHMAYRLWLNSAWLRQDSAALRAVGAKYLAEYPDSPEAQGAVSRYYFDADIEADAGLAAAQKSAALYQQQLGIDGGIGGLTGLRDSLRPDPRPDYLPPDRRGIYFDYLGSRFNLARYWLRLGKYEAALAQVRPVIDAAPYTPDDPQGLAPFLCLAGQASEGAKSPQAAYRYYLRCLLEGGAQGRYALIAQGRLTALNALLSNEMQAKLLGEALPPALAGVVLPRFSDLGAAAGFGDRPCARAAWGDVNGDALEDLLVDGSRLYLNHGSAGFREAGREWGLAAGMNGGVFADPDNDGDLDLATFGSGRSTLRLLRNDGAGFADVTAVSSLSPPTLPVTAACWSDLDADGWVDLAVCGQSQRLSAAAGTGYAWVYYSEAGRFGPAQSALGPGTAPVSALTTLRLADARTGLYCSTRGSDENYLLQPTASGFANLARALGIAGAFSDGAWGDTVATSAGDVTGDGRSDLFVCNFSDSSDNFHFPPSQLLLAEGDTGFREARREWGVRADASLACPGFGDFNSDGRLDLFISSASESRSSWLYLNTGSSFVDVAYLAGCAIPSAQGCASADYDNDGDLDLALCTRSGLRLLRNDSPPQAWLSVRCSGAEGGSGAALGATVTLQMGAVTMLREIRSGTGLGCGDSLLAHFGLGATDGICTVSVRFPSGREYSRALRTGGQRLEVSESNGLNSPPILDAAASTPARDSGPLPNEDVPQRPAGSSRQP